MRFGKWLILVQLALLTAILLIFDPNNIQGQKVEINEQGERIVRFEDGTWRYFEPSDSILIEPTELDLLNQKIATSETHLDKLQQQIEAIEYRKNELEKAKKKNPYNRQILQMEIDSLNDKGENLRYTFQSLEFELEEMKLRWSSLENANDNLPTPKSKNEIDQKWKNRSIRPYNHYSTADDFSCNLQKSKIPGSEKLRYATVKSDWFYYTPKLLEHEYTSDPYLTGKASVMHDGNMYYLQLQILIRDTEAAKSYGWIEAKGALFILTMSGKTLELNTSRESIGQKNQKAGFVRYTLLYPLSPNQVELLGNEQISKLRLVWSSGYEDYDIYDIRFIQERIQCLKSNTQ
ncbi:MAG: hypothetical protein GVX78_03545 [Bacteroidetes bacterium]|jgi:hypothetical protein|nr:hypothetical protein [Bacteroidota bacterium]